MEEISISRIKKYIGKSSKEDLSKDILELFQKFSKIKDFYQFKLSGGRDLKLLEKYKKIIQNVFFPERGLGNARLSVARKAVTDFKKLSGDPNFIADVMIYYVEMGVDFTNEYGDINEPFYESMESMYERAAKFMIENNIANNYINRFKKIVENTSEIGWGFHDDLEYMYNKYFFH